jgi:hypothetical protein
MTGAGSCTVTAHQAGDTNYTAAADVDQIFAIGKATLAVTADDQSKTYGDADPAFTVSYGAFVGSDNASVLDVAPTAGVAGTHDNVNTYSIIPAGGSDDDYDFTYVNGTLTVNQKNVAVSANPQSKVYGDADPSLTYTADPLVGTDSFSGSLARAVGEDVGTYAIGQGTLTAGGNYAITFTGNALEITQASSVTVVTCPASVVYTGSAQEPCTANVTGAGGLNQSTTVAYGNNTAVGTASADASFVGDLNHTGSSDTKTFGITAATASVALSDLTQTYNGSAKSATVVTTPGSLSVDVTYDGGATLPTNAGSYAVVATITDANYSGSATGTLVIEKAPLTVTPDDKTIEFGSPDPVFTLTYGAFQGSDNVGVIDVVPTAGVSGAHTVVADYVINVSGGSDNNYSFTYATGTLHVVDTAAPVIDAHADLIFEAMSATGTFATYASPSATDGADGAVPVNCLPISGSGFALGTSTVTCTAQDSSGNHATSSFLVVVRDTTAPVVIGHPDIATTTFSSLRQAWIFSSVLSFMNGHSLQAQLLLGGAGISTLPGAFFCIWWRMPASVATMNSLVFDSATCKYIFNPRMYSRAITPLEVSDDLITKATIITTKENKILTLNSSSPPKTTIEQIKTNPAKGTPIDSINALHLKFSSQYPRSIRLLAGCNIMLCTR